MYFKSFFTPTQDECSFVSLRDVERVLDVMFWFYDQCVENKPLFRKIREYEDLELDMKREHLETEARHSGENANNIKENDDEFECVDEEQNDIQV